MRNNLTMQVMLELIAEGFVDGLQQAGRSTDEFSESLKGQKPSADAASSSISSLKAQLIGLAAAYFSVSAVKGFLSDVVRTVSATQQLNTRLQGLTNSTTAYNETLSYLSIKSNELNADINTFSQSYSKLLTLQQAGLLTTSEARIITEGYANAAAKSGASNEQLSQSLYGLTQGLSAGTLRAEELNQMTEPLPGLMQQLDKAVGGAAGTFRRMVNDGQVSSDMLKQVLQSALQNYTGAAAATADNIIPTMTRVSNSYQNFKNSLESPVAAFIIPVLEEANRIIADFTAYAIANEKALVQMAQNAALVFTQMMQAAASLALWLFELAQGIINFIANNQSLVIAIISVYAAFVILKQVLLAIVMIKIGLMLNQFLGITAGVVALVSALKSALFAAQAALLVATGTTTVLGALAVALKAVTMAMLGFLATPVGITLVALAAGYIALSAAVDSSRVSLEESHAATQKTVDALKFFRDSINELKNIGPVGDGVVSEIERIRAAMFAGRITEAEARAQTEAYMNAVRERVEEERNLETQINAQKQSLAGQVTQFKIQKLDEAGKANQDKLKEAEQLEKKYTDKVKQLRQDLANDELALQDKLRSLRQKDMSEQGATADQALQIFEKLKAAKDAAAAGDTKAAADLGKQAASLVDGLGDVKGAIAQLAQSGNAAEQALAQTLQENAGQWGIDINELKTNNDLAILLTQQAADTTKLAKMQELVAVEESAQAQRTQIENLKAEYQTLQQQLEELGKPRKTIIDADIQKAESAISQLEQKLEQLKNTQINIGASGSGNVEYRQHGGIIGSFSNGTILPGFGGGDRRMAMLEDGEGILNKDSTRRFRDLFLLMNYKPDDFAALIAPIVNAPRFNTGGIMSFFPDIQPVPRFNSGGIMQSAGGGATQGGGMQVFRLEISKNGRSEGVTLMGEKAELARLNNMLKRVSS